MNADLRAALSRVADVLDETADGLSPGASDVVWFAIDGAIDEAIEAIDDESDALCDAAGAVVPVARRALRHGDVDEARRALHQAATALRAALSERDERDPGHDQHDADGAEEPER